IRTVPNFRKGIWRPQWAITGSPAIFRKRSLISWSFWAGVRERTEKYFLWTNLLKNSDWKKFKKAAPYSTLKNWIGLTDITFAKKILMSWRNFVCRTCPRRRVRARLILITPKKSLLWNGIE